MEPADPTSPSAGDDEPGTAVPGVDEPATAAAPEVARPPKRRRGRKGHPSSPLRNALEWVAVVVGAVLVAVLVRNFVVQSFRIPSPSMHPTLLEGDRVLVNRLSYRLHDVNRGDVVVFERPASAPASPGEPEDLIKRVIALPGDTVVARDGIVYVNDRAVTEPYLAPGTATTNLDTPVKVPEGEVFVMGDNRANSSDSRFIGTIPIDSIVGRAFAIVWPPSRISGL